MSVFLLWPFYQFLWTMFFFTMLLIGFWCIFMFFGFVIPLWLTEGLKEYFGKIKPFNPDDVRRKILPEQGATVIYSSPKGDGPFVHHHEHVPHDSPTYQ